MTWQANAILYVNEGNQWYKITDHNRAPLSIGVERFETRNRMADATLRRYSVAKKRTFQLSWDLLPSIGVSANALALDTVDSGWGGQEIEDFYQRTDGAFKIRLRKGSDRNKAITDSTIEEYTVMITDFSKEVVKRGELVDLWNLSMTLEEV